MTSVAQARASIMPVPTESFYLINVQGLLFVNLILDNTFVCIHLIQYAPQSAAIPTAAISIIIY